MKKSIVALGLLTIALAGAPLHADVLNTHPGPTNNGSTTPWGIFFDLEAIGPGIKVTELQTSSSAAVNAAFSIDVYTRPGTALGTSLTVGPGSSPDGWTLLGNAPATQGAVANGVSLPIDIPDIIVPAGSVVGVALKYNDVGPRYVTDTVYRTYQDSLLKLTTGDSRTVPFTATGSYFQFRTMVGSVTYQLDGLGGAGSANPSPVPQSCSTLLSVNVSLDPAGSTGIQVKGNLTAFGGSSVQAFTETSPGSNVFTYNMAVPAEQQVGPATIVATVTDIEGHTGNGNINLTVAPAFTIVAAADPASVDPGEQSLLTVQVNIPECATSTGHGVVTDLTPIGGSVPQLLYDDGPGGGHGDATAGDHIYSFLATVGLATPNGIHLLPITVFDDQGHEISSTITFAVGGFFDSEPNDTKPTASPANCMSSGDFLQGSSTGTTITGTGALNGADYFRVKTCAAPLGIYKHRLTITTEGTAGHASTIRGLTQTAGVINAGTDAIVQTAATTASGDLPARTVQWFGFGKEEEIYYRVTGAAATTEPYISTLSTTTVSPVVATQVYQPGDITIMRAAGNATDMDIWVYDSNFNAIPCLGRNSPEPITLTGNLASGTYYVAVTNANFANDQASCPPDTLLTGIVTDFPNAAANSSTTTNSNLGISITDFFGTTETLALIKPGAFEIVFVQFTVAPSGSLLATGAATPASADPGDSTLLTVSVTPGQTPPSTGITVTGNLTSVGGSASQSFFDNGSNGDVTPGDNIFSYEATVAPGTPLGDVTLPIHVQDLELRMFDFNIAFHVGLVYCPAGATTTVTTFEWISNVTMNDGSMDTLNNNSGVIQGVRYDDYTLSVPPVNMQSGVGQTIAVTVTEVFENDQVAVYVDWNRDGIFQVPDEATVLNGVPGPTPPTTFTFTGTITPPPGTPSVLTRMRIRMTDVSNAPLDPCGIPSYGEVEDYAVNVQSTGCACPGDMDGSTTRNGLDVSGFAAAVIAGSGACADINGDTTVTNDDISPFVTLILSGAACP